MTLVTLKDRASDPLVKSLYNMSVKEYEVNSDYIVPIMEKNKKPICMFINHSSMISWTAAPTALIDWAEQTGLNNRYDMVANYHKILLGLPILGSVAKRVGGGITLPTIDHAVSFLKSNPNTILGTMPEGSNCAYKHETPVAPFRQFGLIKAAILSDCLILLATQKGTEEWDITIPFKIRPKNRIGLNIPLKFKPIKLRINIDVFNPGITSEAFKALPKVQQRFVITDIAHKMRLQMLRAYNALGENNEQFSSKTQQKVQ